MLSGVLRSTVAVVSLAVFALTASSAKAQSLTYSGTAALSQSVTLVTTGPPGSPYILAASDQPGPSNLPPLPPLAIGMPFFYLVAPGVLPFQPAIGPSGQATFTIQIPLQLNLYGMAFYFQSAFVDAASPLGVSPTNGVSFTIANPAFAPIISMISPSSGPATGGTPVTISGLNFQPGATTVTLGGQAVGNLAIAGPQMITCTTPPGSAATMSDLLVSTAAGGPALLIGAFTYVPVPPAITSIEPDHAQVGGGSLILLRGTGLGLGTTIYLGGSALAPLTQTSTQITAFAPSFQQVGFVDVVAISPQGLQHLPSAFRYTIPLDTGTGADGLFAPTSNTALDTSLRPNGYDFSEVHIPAGVTVTGVGMFPLRIRCRGHVIIEGAVDVSGRSGAEGGTGGPGGFSGGVSGFSLSQELYGLGPGGGRPGSPHAGCASFGTLGTDGGGNFLGVPGIYGSTNPIPLIGGSGGGGCYNQQGGLRGGGGGGALSISAGESIIVEGTINADGGIPDGAPPPNSAAHGGPGSGGAVRLQGLAAIIVSGTIGVRGAVTPYVQSRIAGNGRWLIENWLGQTASGTSPNIPSGVY